MKKKIIGITAALLIGLTGLCFAGEMREIELNDGTVISGELVSFGDGFFTVSTQSLGTLKIDESKVREIRLKGEAPSKADSAAPDVSAADVMTMQQRITSNPDAMALILSLQNNPEVSKILQDPALMEAVQSGNYAAVLSNPNFLKLLNNENVQQITKSLTQPSE